MRQPLFGDIKTVFAEVKMYTDKLGKNWYKVGLHIHTTLSDGHLSPEEVAKRYKAAGFDALAITDHWKYHGEDEICGVKIISGCEYDMGGSDTSSCVMHIVGVGMKNDPAFESRQVEKQTVIDRINSLGGLAILAHPAWSLNSAKDITPLHGFSMLEIYNSVSDAHQSSRPYSGYIADVLANNGYILPLCATDDAHYYDGSDDAKSYIIVNAESGEIEDILDAIRKQKFYATQGPELYVKRDGGKIIAECSECVKIDFLSNTAWAPDRITRGRGLTYAEYEIKSHEKWVRVEVCDENGRYAWSNIITVK